MFGFRRRPRLEIPFNFPSENISCRLTKYFILLQNGEKVLLKTEGAKQEGGLDNKGFNTTGVEGTNTEQVIETDEQALNNPDSSETVDNLHKEHWLSKRADKKHQDSVELVRFQKLTSESRDVTHVPDECAPISVKSSSSVFPTSVSSDESTQKRDESVCEYCGSRRKDSGYHGNGSGNRVCWVTSSSSGASNTIDADEHSWRLPLEQFTSKRQGSKRKHKSFSKPIRSFYKSQDDLINQYEDVRLDLDDAMDNAEEMKKLRKTASLFAKWTFIINFCLLIIKVVAVVLSGSISLISSLVDSSVDLLSGLVIWITTRLVKHTDRYAYPQGRTKLEPMAIVILSVIMSAASLQVIKESVTKLIGLSDGSQKPPLVDFITIGISGVTVVAKLILFLLCRRIKHPTIIALSQDHKNDVLFNSAAIVFGYIGSVQMQEISKMKGLIYLDPAGALLLCVYIITSWCVTGWDQIKLLIGHTASPEFLSKVTWMAVDHHKKIEKVDTVRAFHFGNQFLVEVDIVLPPEMTLQEAHDISEPLQQKIERLPDVERAFVHVDYETEHNPTTEHKQV